MTRLAELKAELAKVRRQLQDTEIAAWLAMDTPSQHTERVPDPTVKGAYYKIKAYGLTRFNGGYVTVRFVCPGQGDTIRFHVFEDWRRELSEHYTETLQGFRIAADRIHMTQYKLLHDAQTAPAAESSTSAESAIPSEVR